MANHPQHEISLKTQLKVISQARVQQGQHGSSQAMSEVRQIQTKLMRSLESLGSINRKDSQFAYEILMPEPTTITHTRTKQGSTRLLKDLLTLGGLSVGISFAYNNRTLLSHDLHHQDGINTTVPIKRSSVTHLNMCGLEINPQFLQQAVHPA